MNGRQPAVADDSSRLSRWLRNLAAVLVTALALTSLARTIVQMVDRVRVRLRKLMSPAAP